MECLIFGVFGWTLAFLLEIIWRRKLAQRVVNDETSNKPCDGCGQYPRILLNVMKLSCVECRHRLADMVAVDSMLKPEP